MTQKEFVLKKHPNAALKTSGGGVVGCPRDYKILPVPVDLCSGSKIQKEELAKNVGTKKWFSLYQPKSRWRRSTNS